MKSLLKNAEDRRSVDGLAKARKLSKNLLKPPPFSKRDAVMAAFNFLDGAKRARRLKARMRLARDRFKASERINADPAQNVLQVILRPHDRNSQKLVSRMARDIRKGLALSIGPEEFQRSLSPSGRVRSRRVPT